MIQVVLDGGPLDGRELNVTHPKAVLRVQRLTWGEGSSPIAVYRPDGNTDLAGRLVYRYEAP